MPARILVVDDERDMVEMVREALTDDGHTVDMAENGAQALAKAALQPDLIILDVMMPGQDGFDVCQTLRSVVACPIVFLSARDREADRIQGLVVGGDDYLVKPFGIKELRARVHAHLRREDRARRASEQSSALRFGDLVMDIPGRAVRYRQEPVACTRREFDIVELLALHPGRVFTKEQIYDKVWGFEAEGDASTVAEHIKKIRAKLATAHADRQYIATLWGVGYKWNGGR